MRSRHLACLLALAAALVAAPAADAAWFPPEPVDSGVSSPADLDLARDGTGGLVYLKDDHVFLSRKRDGAWQAPERVDVGLDTAATEAAIAAADGGRLAIAFVSAGRLYGAIVPGGSQTGLGTPALVYDAGPVAALDADMGINGTAYVAFAAPGGGGSDVRAARIEDVTWEGVPQPLDIDPAQPAGVGAGRARIAVSAEGNAVAVWGEAQHVYGRRVTGLATSLAPQEVSLPDLDGAPGGPADSPSLDIEDDGSYAWAAWRQDFGGVSRTLARRLVGSLFEAPAALDGGAPSSAPRVSMNGRGVGYAVASAPDATVFGSSLENDAFLPASRLDQAGAAVGPLVEVSERGGVVGLWLRGGALWARNRPDDETPFEPEAEVAPASSAVAEGGYVIAADRVGNYAIALLQGDGRIAVAEFDRPPGRPLGASTTKYQRRAQPRFSWRPGIETWGAQQFKLVIDGVEVATTGASRVIAPQPLADGPHRWRVVAVDRRGQAAPSPERYVRVDATPPRLVVHVAGVRKRGRTLKVSVTALDGRGTGFATALIDFGDRTAVARSLTAKHRYRRNGRFTLTVRVADKVGNVARERIRLRIRK